MQTKYLAAAALLAASVVMTAIGALAGAALASDGRDRPPFGTGPGIRTTCTADIADGYQVILDAMVRPATSELRFAFVRNGDRVLDLSSHKGSVGHLVLSQTDGREGAHQHAGRSLEFAVRHNTFDPVELTLHVAHAGRVRTAVFLLDAIRAGCRPADASNMVGEYGRAR